MWPGLVGKGPDSEPPIDLDTMLDLTAAAKVSGVRFDGVDLFLFDPHVDIDSIATSSAACRSHPRPRLRGRFARSARLAADGRRLGDGQRRRPQALPVAGEEGVCDRPNASRSRHPPYGVVRIDSAASPGEWAKDPAGNTKRIAETFREACTIAEGYGERLAAEGEICWGGMHSWKRMLELLEMVGRPQTLGFQADMAHTLLFTLGCNAPEDRILPELRLGRSDTRCAIGTMTSALRPWTIDFHVAQNDATVKGSGSHDKTGRHCLPNDPNGKMDVVRVAGAWLRDESGTPDGRISAHLLGRLHVSQRDDDGRADVARRARHDDRRPRRARHRLTSATAEGEERDRHHLPSP